MRKRSFVSKLVGAPYYVWAAIFIVVPLGMVAYYAFTDGEGGFTLANFAALNNPSYLKSLWMSVVYSLAATVISLVVAYPFAYAMSRMKVNTQRMLLLLVMLPMWMNLIIRTYSLQNIIENSGIINSLLEGIGLPKVQMMNTSGAVIFAMVYNYLPYMILPIYTVMSKIDPGLLEAADDLGANAWQRIRRVVMPLSVPGVISGVTMVFVPSVSTFYISKAMSTGMINLVGDIIESKMKEELNYNVGSSLSLVLMIMIILSIAIMNRFSDSEEGGVIA